VYSDEIQALFKGKGISIGDRIALSLGRVRLEGELMPKANIGSPRTIVIKLDDGYNIGVKHGEGASPGEGGYRHAQHSLVPQGKIGTRW
jgi:hypothetical protein